MLSFKSSCPRSITHVESVGSQQTLLYWREQQQHTVLAPTALAPTSSIQSAVFAVSCHEIHEVYTHVPSFPNATSTNRCGGVGPPSAWGLDPACGMHLFASDVPTKKPLLPGHTAIEVTAPISSHCLPATC